MTRLALALFGVAGWAAALFAVWHVGRVFQEGFAQGLVECDDHAAQRAGA